MYLLVSFIAVAALLIFLYYGPFNKRRKHIIELTNKIPGPPTLPFIGNTHEALIERNEFIPLSRKFVKEYGRLYRLWLGPYPMINVIEAEDIEILLSRVNYIKKSMLYDFLHPWLGAGLLTSFGAKWHSHRKMITPTFHFKILENFMEVFVENSEILIEKLKLPAESSKSFDIYPYITRCALDIICETAMGIELNAQSDTDTEYIRAVYDLSEITVKRMFRLWMHPNLIFKFLPDGRRYEECLKILHGFTNKVIQERKILLSENFQSHHESSSDEDRLLGKKKRKAFLDLLLEVASAGDNISDEEIREEVDTFMFEGHDTTSVGMNFVLFLLGNHPDVQDRVVQELDDIFQGSDRPATIQDLQNMKYLERVIKESLRIYPSVPFIGRQLTEETKLGGYTIPASSMILIHIFHAHRNPKHFPNPEVFNPDNFLPENVQKRHPYAYVPFSAGPRNCIGQKFALMEEKTILSYILRYYKIRSMEKEEDITLLTELILRPENGVKVILTPRKSSARLRN